MPDDAFALLANGVTAKPVRVVDGLVVTGNAQADALERKLHEERKR